MSEPSQCSNCGYTQKTKKYGRHFNYQCILDGGVHEKTFSCKRYKEA